MSSNKILPNQDPILDINPLKIKFTTEDIGKIYWRVEYRGIFKQCLIHRLEENGEAVVKLAILTDLRNNEYKLLENIEYFGSSTYGIKTRLGSNEFYFDFEDAKKASIDRYNKEVNPDGKYKVARYFDDVFECFVTEILDKKTALNKCYILNSKPRAYVSYGLVNIK